jgi:hypothetical protein
MVNTNTRQRKLQKVHFTNWELGAGDAQKETPGAALNMLYSGGDISIYKHKMHYRINKLPHLEMFTCVSCLILSVF